MNSTEKLTAKRFNERTKLSATAINALAVALFGAAIIVPGINKPSDLNGVEANILFFCGNRPTFYRAGFPRSAEERRMILNMQQWLTIAAMVAFFAVLYLLSVHEARKLDRRQPRPGE